MLDVIDRAASALLAGAPVFTSKNLYFEVRRIEAGTGEYADFRRGPLKERLRRGPLCGLLADRCPDAFPQRLSREYDAYYPVAVLLVDKRPILDLFVAGNVLPNARVAVVALDGTPEHIVRWLKRGARAGRRAPVGYLHDASTVAYPFLLEPLATFVDVCDGDPLAYRDLGLPPLGLLPQGLPFAQGLPSTERVTDLEALPPCALFAYALRRLLAMVPGDPMMTALARASHERPMAKGVR